MRQPNKIFSLELVRAGQLRCRTAGRQAVVEPGQVLLKQVGTDLRLRCGPETGCDKIHLSLNGPLLPTLDDLLDLSQHLVVTPADVAGFDQQLRELFVAAVGGAPVQELGDASYGVLTELARGRRRQGPPPALAKVLRYLLRHLAEPLTLADLARVGGCSVRDLTRSFRAHYDTTPMAFIQQARLDRARQLLTDRPDLLVKQVARQCGIPDQRYFARLYRRSFGVAPGHQR